jgi:NADPH-dependent 2,4-dienoyl-CoA reductase/sulfur reductase-like enzyme
MKAAIVAAQRGHDVTLHEAASRLGGEALLAQLMPRPAELVGSSPFLPARPNWPAFI